MRLTGFDWNIVSDKILEIMYVKTGQEVGLNIKYWDEMGDNDNYQRNINRLVALENERIARKQPTIPIWSFAYPEVSIPTIEERLAQYPLPGPKRFAAAFRETGHISPVDYAASSRR